MEAQNDAFEIKTLTTEEIETLQVDSALRLIGEYSTHLNTIRKQISEATIELGRAKMKLDILKNDKQTIVEMIRALKTIADRA